MISALRNSLVTKLEYLLNSKQKFRSAARCPLRRRGSAQVRRCAVEGFLGSHAGYGSDLNLMIQIAMGVALIFGAFLARSKRFVAHGVCQTVVVILNLVIICLWMWPSFHLHVLPRLPERLGKRFYGRDNPWRLRNTGRDSWPVHRTRRRNQDSPGNVAL